MTNSLTVIVPFYNEHLYLEELVKRLVSTKYFVDKFIFVDDGSTDNSVDTLLKALDEHTLTAEILQKENEGKGSAILRAQSTCSTSHIAILDADLELDPAELINLWRPIRDGQEKASFGFREFRAHSSYTFRYAKGNRIISFIYGLVFNVVVTDVMCGYKVIPKDTFSFSKAFSSGFALEVDIAASLWRLRIQPYECLVSYKARSRSEGKIIGWKDAILVIGRIIYLRLRFKKTIKK